MIQLYAKGTADFSKNGIELRPQESTVTFQDNGQYDLEIVVPAGHGYTSFDYGQILKATVPEQYVAAVNLGTVSYYTVTKESTKLYSRVPSMHKVTYSQWEAYRSYSGGDKVTYGDINWQCVTSHGGLNTPPPNGGLWTQIASSQTDAGKVAQTMTTGDTVMKIRDFNATYMEAATLSGVTGYIQISSCEATGESESRVLPARTITEQLFVVTEIRKEQQGHAIRVFAEHISYRLGRTILGDCSVCGITPATAVVFIQGAAKEEYAGSIYTDITEPTIEADWTLTNMQAALMDPKSGLLALTDGRMIRDDLDVFLLTEGTPAPKYAVRYGANMRSVKWTGDVGDIVTRIYPTAQTEDGRTLLLPEEKIDSVRTIPFVRPEVLNTGLKVGQEIENSDGTKTKLTENDVFTRMREAAGNRFSIDKCDQAEVNLELDWVHMPDTEEYAQYTALKNAAPGDWVEVENGPLGISEMIRMTGYRWDPILKIYKNTTFGPNREKASVAGYNIKSGSVTARILAANSVGSSAIQQGSITAREIEANSITADLIASKSIISDLIAANAVTADEISAGAVTAAKIAAGAVTTDKLDAGSVTAAKIAAGAITADKIDAASIAAINAKLGTATIVNGIIDNASISWADIVDANIQNLIARDAITDKYFIDKLAVRQAQMVYATIGELIIKASNGNYYRLDVGADGSVTPTQVTPTSAEIAAGVTSDGHASIIETDLTVADLSASNLKAINALIDKLTASRIDVSELWARQAFINQLMVTDISSNSYIQSTIGNWVSGSTITQTIDSLDSRISSLGYGTVFMQPDEPDHSGLVAGDIWIQTQNSGTWEQVNDDYSSWQDIYNSMDSWQTLASVQIMWVWDGRQFQEMYDANLPDVLETRISQTESEILLMASQISDKYTIQSGISIEAAGVRVSGNQYVVIESGGYFAVTTGNFGIDTSSATYVMWSGAAAASDAPFWLKKDGTIHATSGTIGGWTLAANSMSSGSGASYVNINSNSSNTYAMWAGAEAVANAPFRLKRDGTLYITQLIALNANNTETTVNLYNAGLWKLGYNTVKTVTVTDGYVSGMELSNGDTVNFSSAALGYASAARASYSVRTGNTVSTAIPTTSGGVASATYTATTDNNFSIHWGESKVIDGSVYVLARDTYLTGSAWVEWS